MEEFRKKVLEDSQKALLGEYQKQILRDVPEWILKCIPMSIIWVILKKKENESQNEMPRKQMEYLRELLKATH